MKAKKADGNMVWIIVTVALMLLFAAIYIVGWKNIFGKNVKVIEGQIDATGDFDNDLVINLRDKCPCQPGETSNSGCPFENKDERKLPCENDA